MRVLLFPRSAFSLTVLFLLIEFFDELNYGIRNAAMPAIRAELGLNYAQVGLLLGLPHIVGSSLEPILMLLGDTQLRKRLVVGGGAAIFLTLVTVALTRSFLPLLVALVLGFMASGAFVTLSQATMMDLNRGREAEMMARWTAAGSLASLVGPLLLASVFSMGLSWRWAFAGLAAFCLCLTLTAMLKRFPLYWTTGDVHSKGTVSDSQPLARRTTAKTLLEGLKQGLRNRSLLRWFVLLQLSDLLLDVLLGYLPLYFTDVMGLSLNQTSLLLSILMVAGLTADILLIPILKRFPGRKVVRLSAGVVTVLYIAWLLISPLWAKIGLIILIKLCTLGWYQVLQGEAFASFPGRSGTVMALNAVFGLTAGAAVWFIGWVAAQLGLPAAMWVLLLGPLSLFAFVPGFSRTPQPSSS